MLVSVLYGFGFDSYLSGDHVRIIPLGGPIAKISCGPQSFPALIY